MEEYLNGFAGDATIGNGSAGSFTFPVIGWSVTPTPTILTYLNSKVGNHPQRASTYLDFSCNIEIDFSAADQPFQDDVAIYPGTFVTNVNLIISDASNMGWTATNMIVSGMPQSLQRAGKVVTSMNLMISGGTLRAPGQTVGT